MSYRPEPKTAGMLDRAHRYTESVPYHVTARWTFYRVHQDGTLPGKSAYHGTFLPRTKDARESFYGPWRPDTFADDTRTPVLMERTGFYTLHIRGNGFSSEQEWLETVGRELNCPLDRWADQPSYVEIHFEAGAMEAQFLYYAPASVPLLAFHGDVTLTPIWDTTVRIVERWLGHQDRDAIVLYYGDLDAKGLAIPKNAHRRIREFAVNALAEHLFGPNRYGWRTEDERVTLEDHYNRFLEHFQFIRMGLNDEVVAMAIVRSPAGRAAGLHDDDLAPHAGESHISDYAIPENPERLGTFQWEALDDDAARLLIERAAMYLDLTALQRIDEQEREAVERLRERLGYETHE